MKKIMALILLGIFSFCVWATVSCGLEHLKVINIKEEFISKGVYDETRSRRDLKFYTVEADFILDSPTYTVSGDTIYPGGPGDIICTLEAAITLPIIGPGISYYIGGHAAMSGFDYKDKNKRIYVSDDFEITGFGNNITATYKNKSYWNNKYNYDEVFAFRVDTTLDNRLRAFNKALSFYGEEYNYSFIFNNFNSKYCSNLVSRAYNDVGIYMNYDRVATTILDLMVNPYVYLTYYSFYDEEGIRNVYVLE